MLRRADGAPAYNLAVVVDDAAQGIEEVVRGDDLLDTTPRQVLLARLLGLPEPAYAHVPLVLGPDGERLAKRHGAVTLAGLAERGVGADVVRSRLAASLGLAEPGEPVTAAELVDRFDPAGVPRRPVDGRPGGVDGLRRHGAGRAHRPVAAGRRPCAGAPGRERSGCRGATGASAGWRPSLAGASIVGRVRRARAARAHRGPARPACGPAPRRATASACSPPVASPPTR